VYGRDCAVIVAGSRFSPERSSPIRHRIGFRALIDWDVTRARRVVTWCKSTAAAARCHVFTCVKGCGWGRTSGVCCARKTGVRVGEDACEPQTRGRRSSRRRRRRRRRCKANLSDPSNSRVVRARPYTCQTDWQHPFPLLRRPETPARRELFAFFLVFVPVFFSFYFFFRFFTSFRFIYPSPVVGAATLGVYRNTITTVRCYRCDFDPGPGEPAIAITF